MNDIKEKIQAFLKENGSDYISSDAHGDYWFDDEALANDITEMLENRVSKDIPQKYNIITVKMFEEMFEEVTEEEQNGETAENVTMEWDAADEATIIKFDVDGDDYGVHGGNIMRIKWRQGDITVHLCEMMESGGVAEALEEKMEEFVSSKSLS